MKMSWEDHLRPKYIELFELVDDASTPVFFDCVFREFGIHRYNISDGSQLDSYDVIAYCPVTGKRLPSSLRDLFFNEIEGLGIVYPADDHLPTKYKSADWWASREDLVP